MWKSLFRLFYGFIFTLALSAVTWIFAGAGLYAFEAGQLGALVFVALYLIGLFEFYQIAKWYGKVIDKEKEHYKE